MSKNKVILMKPSKNGAFVLLSTPSTDIVMCKLVMRTTKSPSHNNITSVSEFEKIMRSLKESDTIKITVMKNGRN